MTMMVPLPKAGAGFAGATAVRRPGESGPGVDEQSFADRFDRALSDTRSRNDRADSAAASNAQDPTGGTGTRKPDYEEDRVDEVRHEPSHLNKADAANVADAVDTDDKQAPTAVVESKSSDVEQAHSGQVVDGATTNEVAVSIAAAFDIKSSFPSPEVTLPLLRGSEEATIETDAAVSILGSTQPANGDIAAGEQAATADSRVESGGSLLLQEQTVPTATMPARPDILVETPPDETKADVAAPSSIAPVQDQAEALNFDSEVTATLAASNNDAELETEDLTVAPEEDAGLEMLGGSSDDAVIARSAAGEPSATSDKAQPSTTSVVAASSSPAPSLVAARTLSSGGEANPSRTGSIEVATNTNSAAPIELGPNLVAVASNSTPTPTPGSTNPLPTTQQTTMEAAISRIADTVEALSKQPPPRAISLDFGEAHGIRVRIAIDAGAINVTVADAGAGTSDTANWQRQLSESFDQQQGDKERQQLPIDDDAGPHAARTSPRQTRQDAGLRL